MTGRPDLIQCRNALHALITATMDRVAREAPGVDPYEVTDHNGQPLLAPILVAYANVVVALANVDGGHP